MRFRLTLIVAAALTCSAPAAVLAVSIEENEVAGRLARNATEFLDQLLGVGRAKVLVTVEGESSEIKTQTEVMTPIMQEQDTEGSLPGYISEEKAAVEYYQKDSEQASRRQSFRIKRIRISAVLDDSLSDAQVNTVRRVLPELLRMDGDRGDDLIILRAKLLPAWRRAFQTPTGARILVLTIVALLTTLLICFMAYMGATQAARTLGAELAKGHGAPLPGGPGGALPAEALAMGGELPEFTAGGLPGLGAVGGEAGPSDAPQLGQRFDFLSDKEPAVIAELLRKEPPDDVALLFANLSNTHPDLSSRIFSILPTDVQASASQALLKLDMADPERLAMLENRLKTAVEFGVRGHERLSSILSRMPAEERESVLGELMNKDPKGAQDVEKSLFPFEGIADFKPEELRRLIVTVSYEDWGTALRGSPEELSQRILAELPAGTRNLVRDSASSPQPKEKVLEARSKILSQVFALAAKGQIILRQEGASSELI